MYNEVYAAMVIAGVATELAEPIWVNKEQEETSEEEAFGRKVTHLLTRPDYVVFVDEVGSNLSQEGDGAVGGERKIVGRGSVPRESASTNDTHFTVLGFTAATGQPIMCAVIVEGKTLKPEVVTGLDVFATKVGDESDPDFIANNTGDGKLYPYGPSCFFKGKEVPCMVCNTESGSITSELLVSFLNKMDDLELFPRQDGLKPFLLLDGHGSRLELPFLQYVNDEDHRWIVCIGVPYGTSYWQVGDSSEQNGSYKMALTKSKRELVIKKQRSCFKNPRVEPYEIVMIVHEAWKKSFGRVEFNREAIAARGWYPLTRNLLDHPEIAATKEKEAEQTAESTNSGRSNEATASTLNFGNGLANTLMIDILQNIDRDAVRQQIRSNQQEGRQALHTLAESKKLTAGLVFKSGRAWLGPEVLQEQMERKRKKDDKERETRDKQRMEQEKKKRAYEKACGEVANLEPSRWSVSQLRAMISYKKRKTDKWPQLKTRAQMLEVWETIKLRPVEEEQQQPPITRTDTTSDENAASAALLQLLQFDEADEDEEQEIEQVGV